MQGKKEKAKTIRNADRKSAITRQRILDAADSLFIDRGFDGVSINDVAVKAEVTKALVFYYFKNKQDLFDTVLEYYHSAVNKALISAVDSEGSIRKRIHTGIDAFIQFIEENPGYPRLIQREICSRPEDQPKITQHLKDTYEWGRGMFEGILSDQGPYLFHHVLMSFFGMIINYYIWTPVLKDVFDLDPMDKNQLEQRRVHVHRMVDAMMNSLISGSILDT